MPEVYAQRLASFSKEVESLDSKLAHLRWLRMLLFVSIVFCIVQMVRLAPEAVWIASLLLSAAAFIACVRVSNIWEEKRALAKVMLSIQEEEIRIANNDWKWRDHGKSFIPANHFYAFDLDVFGEAGLYQYMHRVATPHGARTLAQRLLFRTDSSQLKSTQEAVAWLAPQLHLRQLFYARARLATALSATEGTLKHWAATSSQPLSGATRASMFVLPMAFLASVLWAWMGGSSAAITIAGALFSSQLALMAAHFKVMQRELEKLHTLEQTLAEVAQMAALIESLPSDCERVNALKAQLHSDSEAASLALKRLGRLFSNMASLQNLAALLLFSGTGLYHLHVYKSLLKWKSENGARLDQWLATLGEMEFLCSLAQFHYQHPTYAFPCIDAHGSPSFTAMGHPLIPAEKRITNDVHFNEQRFIVLTGSNMSGKSTFLRTLGVNMLLANMGAPVCATAAVHKPIDVVVSMRLSDSLSDDASYFYAEVERLRLVFEHLEKTSSFVLLDEILRGTNSDDKRSGTIAVLRRLAQSNAYGALATHDLEVCATSDEFPQILVNKCFEVDIRDNELHFDYRLREGICKSRSATFLMKKKGIITDQA